MPSSKDLIPVQNRVLIEAEKVLGKKGISGLELKYIAKILKVAPSTINYHYSSSEELIFDTALFSYKKYVQGIFDESANISDPEKVLRIWIKNTFEWTKELPGIGVILEFPRQVIKYDKNSPAKAEELLKRFFALHRRLEYKMLPFYVLRSDRFRRNKALDCISQRKLHFLLQRILNLQPFVQPLALPH